MDKLLAFTIIGLSTGAIYAVAASGLVVTYTTSGIFNLAHGATGMLSAFVYWQFRFAWNWPAPFALLMVLAVLCPLFGALSERVIMRGLLGTSEVVRLSVTVGMFAAMLGLANWVWPDQTSKEAFQPFFAGNTVSVFDYNVSWHKLITFGCAVLVAVFLRVLLFRTRMGVAMRAVVDDRSLSELNGGRPDRVAMFAWALSASLAGLAGVLLAGEVQLNVEPLVLLVINAYAAAIFGRLRNLPMTFIGAVIIGLADAYYLAYSGASWFPTSAFGFSLSGLRIALPTILLFVVLIAMPHSRLRAGASRLREDSRVPSWSTAVLGAVLLVAFTVAISGMLTRQNTLLLIDGFLFALAALSLVPLTGFAGQVSLAPLTFAGLGAIAMTKLPGNGNVLALIGAMAIVAIVGAIVALPALRLQGVYLALATAAFAILVSKLVFNQKQTFQTGSLTVPALRFPGGDLASPRARLIGLSVCFSVLALSVVALRRSRLGRRLVALKDSPIAGATLGINLTATKVLAFGISAAIAASSGALAGKGVGPSDFDFVKSLPIVLLAVVGGVGTVSGALLGGMLLGGNSILAKVVPSFTNISRVMPGIIGISLGRNPNGASSQTAEGFRPLLGRWNLIGAGVAGGVATWALTAADVIPRWSFVFAIVTWTLGVVPNLPALADTTSVPRRAWAGGWMTAGLLVATIVDWDTTVTSNGWRIVMLIGLVALVGPIASRILDATPRVAAESPDVAGLYGPFAARDIEVAERALGVVI
ncbi:MAG: ABC transporter permease [Acidimicrobiia bacterium]